MIDTSHDVTLNNGNRKSWTNQSLEKALKSAKNEVPVKKAAPHALYCYSHHADDASHETQYIGMSWIIKLNQMLEEKRIQHLSEIDTRDFMLQRYTPRS